MRPTVIYGIQNGYTLGKYQFVDGKNMSGQKGVKYVQDGIPI